MKKKLSEMGDSISIHAPRGGSDSKFIYITDGQSTISIHAPRGGSDFYQNKKRANL